MRALSDMFACEEHVRTARKKLFRMTTAVNKTAEVQDA
jgi:hypothetical protein